MDKQTEGTRSLEPWNKGKLIGQKAPLRLKDIWAIRVRLQLSERHRELALFNLAIDSDLRFERVAILAVSSRGNFNQGELADEEAIYRRTDHRDPA